METIERKETPWWFWPNLLSLDAPVVAVAWFWMFSQTWGVRSLPWSSSVTLFVAVWVVYSLDRVIDGRGRVAESAQQERHQFHRRYQKWFLLGAAAGVGWCLYASLALLSQNALIYGCFVVLLVLFYFVLVIVSRNSGEPSLAKNFIAGLTFAYGTAAGVHAYSPVLVFNEMLFSWEVWMFGLLCALNMTAVDLWELEGEEGEDAAALVSTGAMALAVVSVYLAWTSGAWAKPFHYGIVAGAGGIYFLNRTRAQFSRQEQRAWVDVALFAPVLVFWVWTTYQRAVLD